MVRFHPVYFLGTGGLLLLEIFIAVAVHDAFIRPYAGDFLATIFLFCLIKSFLSTPTGRVAVAALLLSYLIEILQYVHLLRFLRLEHFRAARIVFGSSFEWADLLAYTLGAAVVVAAEAARCTFAARQTG